MKRKVMIAISSVAVAAVLGLGIYHSNAAQAEPGLSKSEIEKLVNAQYPGTITDGPNLDKGFNKAIYEVEVEDNGKKYEIELDGNTGEILKLEEKEMKVASNNESGENVKEKNDDKNKSADDQNKVDGKNDSSSKQPQKVDDSSKQVQNDDSKQNKSKKDSTKKVVIDTEAAKKIALNEFAGTVKELELNEDDGRLIYEIEIEGANGEAELEVDAYTGEITYISIDSENGTSNENNSTQSGKNGDSDDSDDDAEDDEDWDDDSDDDGDND